MCINIFSSWKIYNTLNCTPIVPPVFSDPAQPEIKKKISAWPCPKEKLKFRSKPGMVWKGNCNFGPSPTRPGTKLKILARAQPRQFFFQFRSRQLGLIDFKTNPFSCLHIINVFFCCWFIFPQIIKTNDLVLIAFS